MRRLIPVLGLVLIFATMAWADDTDKKTGGPTPSFEQQIDKTKQVDEQKAAEQRRLEHQIECDDIANHAQQGKRSAEYLDCISHLPK